MKKLKKFLAMAVLIVITFTMFNCIKDKDTDTLPKYTVIFDTNGGTFDTNGGNEMPSIQITEGEKVTRPIDPTREGYNFVEWRKEGETTAFDFNIPITDNITLKAFWNKKIYIVTFDTDEGTPVPSAEEVLYGDKVTKPTDPTKSGYDFVEWQLEGQTFDFDITPITASITLKAIWSNKQLFTVTFDTDGGDDEIQSAKIVEGEKVIKPNDLTKEGYIFKEWQLADGTTFDFINTPITSDITLKAVWDKKEFTVTFNTDGGTPASFTEKVFYEENVTKPNDPIKERYILREWQLADGTTFDFINTPITSDITLKAVWDKKEFTVTFNTDGETPASFTEKVFYEEKITKPNDPTKEGYIFKEWQLVDGTTFDFINTPITSDITLKAVWDKKEFTVTFNTDGGTPASFTEKVFYEEKVIKPNDPTKEGYIFKGWVNI